MAAQDLERLVVQLSADLTRYERSLARAQGVTNKRLGAMQRQATASSKAIAASFLRAGASIGGAFIGAAAAKEAVALSDAATRIDNALKIAGQSGAALEKTYDSLFASASKYSVPLEALVELYSRVSIVQNELGVSNEQVVKLTDNVALALRASGKSAQEASGALLQLSQALGGGVVRAEEFNSIQEGALPILQAAAAGITEAEGSVAKLRQIMLDGNLSSRAFFEGIQAGSVVLEQRLRGSVLTTEQATTNFKNALFRLAREFNASTGAGERFATGIDGVARAINGVDISGFVQKIQEAKSELDSFLSGIGNAQIFKDLNDLLGVTDAEGNVINLDAEKAKDETAGLEREVKLLQERIALNTELGFDNTEALARLGEVQQALANLRAQAANLPATVPGYSVGSGGVEPNTGGTNGQMGGSRIRGGARRPPVVSTVSTADFPAASSSSGGSGRKGRGGGGRNSDDYQREIEQIKERTLALQAETAAMAQVNPLVNDYGFALEKARAESDLLAAAQKEGMAITPALKAQIEQLAIGYANASVAAEQLQDSQEKARRAADEFRDSAKDITSGFISDLRSGVSAADALSNALNRVLDKLIDIGLNSLFGTGGGGGGFLGGLFSIFGFAKGGIASRGKPMKTFSRGGVSRSAAIFGEAGPEAAVPLPDGRSIPVKFQAPAIPKRSHAAGGGNMAVQVGVTVDDDGKLQAYVKKVSQQEVGAAAPKIVQAANQSAPAAVARHQRDKSGGEWR